MNVAWYADKIYTFDYIKKGKHLSVDSRIPYALLSRWYLTFFVRVVYLHPNILLYFFPYLLFAFVNQKFLTVFKCKWFIMIAGKKLSRRNLSFTSITNTMSDCANLHTIPLFANMYFYSSMLVQSIRIYHETQRDRMPISQIVIL